MTLRTYQTEAVDAAYDAWADGENALVVLPTGSGKTHVIAQVAKDAVEQKERVLVVAHVKELLHQSMEKLKTAAPDLDVGIYSAGIGRRDTEQPVIICGIQSVFDKAALLGHRDTVIIDEVHRVPREETSRYQTLLSGLRATNAGVKVLGLTATPYRMDAGYIYGKDQIFSRTCYEASIVDLMEQGHLSRISNKAGAKDALPNLKGIRTRAGDFDQDELSKRVNDEKTVTAMVADVLVKSKDRKSILVFGVDIAHCGMIRRLIAEAGEVVDLVTGDTPSHERVAILDGFKKGEIRFLVNCQVLTEGFDAPGVDCVVLGRPTQSAGLYYQMVGRGFRLAPGKADCLILDYGFNVVTHGPVNAIEVKAPGTGTGPTENAKECPECKTLVAAGVMECPDCQHRFPPRERAMPAATPDQISQIIAPDGLDWRKVIDVKYFAHTKRGAAPGHPRSLRIDMYWAINDKASLFIHVEHRGLSRQSAKSWWATNCAYPFSASAEEAAEMGNRGCFAPPEMVAMIRVPGKDHPQVRVRTGPVPPVGTVNNQQSINTLNF